MIFIRNYLWHFCLFYSKPESCCTGEVHDSRENKEIHALQDLRWTKSFAISVRSQCNFHELRVRSQ